MIKVKTKGDWSKTFRFLKKATKLSLPYILDKYAKIGVDMLSQATPVDTGLAASSWNYKVEQWDGKSKITWYNSDIENGYNVAILIQYGHGVNGGGYVQGIDFINPAMKPVFDDMVEALWKEVEGL